jgi:thiamine-phosphate pyrophosphorylase
VNGFYAIVDAPADAGAAVALAGRLLAGGACALQLRAKRTPTRALVEIGRALRAVVRGVPFIVNDRIDVALLVGADGVHLGQDDLSLADARRIAPGLLVGVSTHDLEQVRAAAGADYLGFGPVFATATKERPDPVQGLDGLAAAVRAAAPAPVVAIGGITVAAAPAVAAAGAAAAAVIAAVNGAPDPTAAARAVAGALRAR